MNCRELARIVSSGHLEGAGFGTWFSIRLHLLVCGSCRVYVWQMARIGDAIRALFSSPPAIEDLERRIIEPLETPDSR